MTMEDVISEVSYSQPWSQGTTDHEALSDRWVAGEYVVVAVQSTSYRMHWLYVSLSSCIHIYIV